MPIEREPAELVEERLRTTLHAARRRADDAEAELARVKEERDRATARTAELIAELEQERKWHYEQADKAASLEKQLSEAQAQLAKVEAREAEGVRVFDKLVADLRAQNATQRESVDTAMRAEREARALLLELRNALDADGMVLDLNAALSRIDAYLAAPAQEQPRAAPSDEHDCNDDPDCQLCHHIGGLPKEGGEQP